MNENLQVGVATPKDERRASWVSVVTTVLVVIAAGYVFFLLYQAVYLNWQTSQKIKNLKSQLSELDRDKARLQSLIAYYQTDAFQELEARKKLGMKMPGEKVIQVKVEEEQNKAATNVDQAKNEIPIQNKSNLQKWFDYLRGEQV